jgi:catechol 1,2-dioxygenase
MRHKLITSRREFVAAGLVLLPFLRTGACATEENCSPTSRGAGGPFYRKGAPWTTKLCGAEEPGEPLVIAGRVVAADTCKPLGGAIVDVFQANAAGLYDTQLPNADPNRFHLRGQMKTDDDGRYQFETILPGNYGDGGFQRARHIHYIVSFPGYRPLVTECYFEGDEHNATDRLVRAPLIIGLSETTSEKRKRLKGTFDIVLAKA